MAGPRDRQAIDELHDKLHAQGKVHWATDHTPVANPVFVVWKKVTRDDGSTEEIPRAVIDSRGSNAILQPDIYPSTTLDDIKELCQGMKVLTVLDCGSWYNQCRAHPLFFKY